MDSVDPKLNRFQKIRIHFWETRFVVHISTTLYFPHKKHSQSLHACPRFPLANFLKYLIRYNNIGIPISNYLNYIISLPAFLSHTQIAFQLWDYFFFYLGYSVPQKNGFWSSPAGNPVIIIKQWRTRANSKQLNNKARNFLKHIKKPGTRDFFRSFMVNSTNQIVSIKILNQKHSMPRQATFKCI